MKMPYGAYKDEGMEAIPSDYLKWVAKNWNEDSPRNRAICEAADREWQWSIYLILENSIFHVTHVDGQKLWGKWNENEVSHGYKNR